MNELIRIYASFMDKSGGAETIITACHLTFDRLTGLFGSLNWFELPKIIYFLEIMQIILHSCTLLT